MWESETDSDDTDNTSKNKYQSDVGNKNEEIVTSKENIQRSKEITMKSNSKKNVVSVRNYFLIYLCETCNIINFAMKFK